MTECFRARWLSVALPVLLASSLLPRAAGAVTSAELYTSTANHYGRFEARLRFAAGDGVVSSFFLWKDGSEQAGTFWNELDFEKLGADCHVQTNALFGNPVGDHGKKATLGADLCSAYHVYAYEWLPDSIAWLVDGVEIRRETGDVAKAYADNAPNGMQIHFNVWPGDATFGGNFDPKILPVHEYIDWVQFSPYSNGAFATAMWREDFNGQTVPSAFLTGNWASPKNLSTNDAKNVSLIDGYAVLSLTADNATGPAGAMPTGGASGLGGSSGVAGAGASGAAGSAAGGASPTAGSGAAGASNAMGGAASENAGSATVAGATAAGAPPTAGGAGGVNGVVEPHAESSSGCGCIEAGARAPQRSGLAAGLSLFAAVMGAAVRRRRVARR